MTGKIVKAALSNGGIAIGRMPTGETDMGRISTMTQELYHGHLYRRHVSNFHEDDNGCPIQKGVFAKIIEFLSDIDTDCSKPAPYIHGAIGQYPETGEGGFIGGDRGVLGIRVDVRTPSPTGASYSPDQKWKLVLYDPCPTGPLDRQSQSTDLLNTYKWLEKKGWYICH